MPAPRPAFFDLTRIHLPPGAWASILHRASGALLALTAPVLLLVWAESLSDARVHARLAGWLGGAPGRLAALALFWALAHHLLAGLRHLALDVGWGESRAAARRSALAVSLGAAALTALLGAWAFSTWLFSA